MPMPDWYESWTTRDPAPLPAASPDEILYARLTTRLIGVMHRVGMTHPQMVVVVEELYAASQELADAIQGELADQNPPEPEPVVEYLSVPLACRACRRDLGRVTVPRDLVGDTKGVLCTGCEREGR